MCVSHNHAPAKCQPAGLLQPPADLPDATWPALVEAVLAEQERQALNPLAADDQTSTIRSSQADESIETDTPLWRRTRRTFQLARTLGTLGGFPDR